MCFISRTSSSNASTLSLRSPKSSSAMSCRRFSSCRGGLEAIGPLQTVTMPRCINCQQPEVAHLDFFQRLKVLLCIGLCSLCSLAGIQELLICSLSSNLSSQDTPVQGSGFVIVFLLVAICWPHTARSAGSVKLLGQEAYRHGKFWSCKPFCNALA